jgi:serine/threonine-protein kinase
MSPSSEEFLERALSSAFALSPEDKPVQAHPSPKGPVRLPEQIGRYPVEALVGRGGTGLVLRVRDTELDRPIALKVLHEHLASDAEMVRRFVEEAKVGGTLEHPGVVPVHDLGRTEDGRPFFTMKLVEGETLAARLALRAPTGADRIEFLTIFEKVCQIVAYAHARGIVHLDLKPSNVLVGGFGEILVTDWGFAADLSNPHEGAEAPASRIVGTPAYMAPEQARGDVARVGCRSDVFALGGILCEILTGVPAYAGDSAPEILLAASRAWLDDAWQRLDACGADPALVALTRRCLAPEPADRPADAGAIAEEIVQYQRSLDERARQLAIDAAEARATAAGERRRRRLVLALTGVGVLAAVLGCGFWLWVERDRAERLRDDDRLAAAIAERVKVLVEKARSGPEPQPALWEEPVARARQAADLARTRGLPGDLIERLEELVRMTEAGRASAVQEDGVLKELMLVHERVGDRESAHKDKDYAAAFKRIGIDVETLGPAGTASRLEGSRIKAHLVDALDDWAHARRTARIPGAEILMEAANRADSDRVRIDVRKAVAAGDFATLEALAASKDLDGAPVETRLLLAKSLRRAGRTAAATAVLEEAEIHYPADYDVHHELASIMRDREKPDIQGAIREFSIAFALRPRSAHAMVDLAQVLAVAGNTRSARRALDEALRVDEKYAPAWHLLGGIDLAEKNYAAADPLFAKAIELDPTYAPSRIGRGVALREARKYEAAAAEFRAAADLKPADVEIWCDLGQVLVWSGRFTEAKAAFEKCHALGSARGAAWTHPSGEWLDNVDLLIEAERELADIPPDLGARDATVLFKLVGPAMLLGRSLTAARIMDRAFKKAAGQEPPVSVWLTAARAAASAGTGAGKEAVDPAEAATWRAKALTWLTAALDALENLDPSAGTGEPPVSLSDVLVDPAYAGVRDPARLQALSSEESQSWAATWERVGRLASPPKPR